MKTLTRILFAIAIISIALTSCKKGGSKKNNNNTSGYYVKFTLNGSQRNYTQLVAAATTGSGSSFVTAITGASYNNNQSASESLVIAIFSKQALQPNSTYNLITDTVVSNFMSMTYVNGSNSYQNEDYKAGEQGTVTVTSVTSKTLNGTFSGKLYNAGGQFVTVSNGEFYVPYTVH